MSLLLYVLNLQTLKEVKHQNRNITNSIKSDAVDKIHISHRELFSEVISNDEYASLFRFSDNDDSVSKIKINFIVTFFINNTFTAYYYHKQGFIDKSYWNGY